MTAAVTVLGEKNIEAVVDYLSSLAKSSARRANRAPPSRRVSV
jgi:hypothetical protein